MAAFVGLSMDSWLRTEQTDGVLRVQGYIAAWAYHNLIDFKRHSCCRQRRTTLRLSAAAALGRSEVQERHFGDNPLTLVSCLLLSSASHA